MSQNHFATGHCQCGQVKYTISAAPVRMAQCHCDDCRRSSGTGHISNAFFKKDDVVIDGDTSSHESVTDSGATLTRYFCPECGSRLFGTNNNNANLISVTAGTVDNSEWFKPDLVVYRRSKPDWDLMDGDIATFDAMPPAKT